MAVAGVAVPETDKTLAVRFDGIHPGELRKWAAVQRARMMARYDAAVTTIDNQNHWAAADNLSSVAANSPSVRATLRKRARYEVANNTYARHLVRTIGNHTIGTGPRLQILSGDKNAARQVQKSFMQWTREVRLGAKLRLMRAERAFNGEAFGVLTVNPGLMHPIRLDVMNVEADRVADPYASGLDPSNIDGVLIDAWGNPQMYRVLRYHPGDMIVPNPMESIEVPARDMLHWFALDRSGQQRGVPEIAPALPLFANLRRFTLAVIAAAESAADAAGVVYSDLPPDDLDGDGDTAMSGKFVAMEKRMWLTLPRGYSIKQIEAEQPATTYADFKKCILQEIGAALSVPYNIAAADSSGYNYSSGRLDHEVYVNGIWIERDDAESVLLTKLLYSWFELARLTSGFLPAGFDSEGLPEHAWHWDTVQLGDEYKRAMARDVALRNGTATYADIFAEDGFDWEDKFEQAARERERRTQLGLPDLTTFSPSMQPQSNQQPIEE